MRIFFIPAALCLGLYFLGNLKLLKEVSWKWQKACVDRVPRHSFAPVPKALVCGEDPEPAWLRDWLLHLGLLHLVVASAAQVHFLVRLAKKIHPIGIPFFLLSFLVVSGFQAPLMRASLTWLYASLEGFFKWGQNKHRAFLFAWIGSLAWNPSWAQSLSWHLTQAASMALLCLPLKSEDPLWKKLILTQAWVGLFLLPYQMAWNQLRWEAFAANLLLAPVVSGFLFPLALLELALPPTSVWMEALMQACLQVSEILFGKSSLTEASTYPLPSALQRHLWTCFLLLLLWGFQWEKQARDPHE